MITRGSVSESRVMPVAEGLWEESSRSNGFGGV